MHGLEPRHDNIKGHHVVGVTHVAHGDLLDLRHVCKAAAFPLPITPRNKRRVIGEGDIVRDIRYIPVAARPIDRLPRVGEDVMVKDGPPLAVGFAAVWSSSSPVGKAEGGGVCKAGGAA